jgi:hypothetical protein
MLAVGFNPREAGPKNRVAQATPESLRNDVNVQKGERGGHNERWLTSGVEADVRRTLAEFCRAHKFTALQIGGVDDHVHLAARPRWL